MSKPNSASMAGVRVGVIGLGTMGLPIARHLVRRAALDRGQVIVMGRPNKTDELARAGASIATSAQEIGAHADLILLVVPDLADVVDVVEGPTGIVRGVPDHEECLIVIHSTVSGTGLAQLDDRLQERTGGRVRLVDAPVSGGEEGAIGGTLSLMLGGQPDDVARVLPVVSVYGVPHVFGGLGSGQVVKACNQMIVGSTILALAEASVIAERSGIDLRPMFEALAGGYASSRMLETRAERLINDDFRASGQLRYLAKDLLLAFELAQQTRTEATQLANALTFFTEAGAEYGGDDMAAAKRVVQVRSHLLSNDHIAEA